MHRRTLYGKTRQQAAELLRAAVAQRDKGLLPPGKSGTVGTFLRTWLDGARPSLKPASWQRYDDAVRLHLTPLLGSVQLAKLTPEQCQAAYAALLDRGLSPGTVRRDHATLRRALEMAVRWRRLSVNAAALATPPRPPRREMTALSAEQSRSLLAAAAGKPLEALLTLAVTAGLRQGELCALRWDDVDLEHGTLRVVATVQRVRGRGLVVSEPKTTRSRRRVELGAAAVASLARHRSAQAAERLRAGTMWTDRGLVFTGPTGAHLDKALLTRRFRGLLADAGLPPVRFHDLRHTAATLMLGRGVHPKIVSEMLGHSTVAITLDLYSHVTPTMQREAASAMDALLRGE